VDIVGLYNYWIVIFLMMTGFYIVISRRNLVKKVIGLSIFQTSVLLLYITMGKVRHGTVPILPSHDQAASAASHSGGAAEVLYSHPLPSVLMLTAIVVGVATTALGLALIVRIQEVYGTIEEDEIVAIDLQGVA